MCDEGNLPRLFSLGQSANGILDSRLSAKLQKICFPAHLGGLPCWIDERIKVFASFPILAGPNPWPSNTHFQAKKSEQSCRALDKISGYPN